MDKRRGSETVKKIDFKKQLPKLVITILILFFVVGLAWGLRSVLELEGTMEPNISKASLSPVPETKEALISYVLTAVKKAEEEKPALAFSDAFQVDADSIRAGDVQSTAEYIRTGVEEKLGALRGDIVSEFGEDLSGKLWVPEITPGDIASAELKYDYWRCPACGRETDEKPEACEDCDTKAGFLQKYRDNYTITLHAPDTAEPAAAAFFARNFHPFTQTEIGQLIRENAQGWFECGSGYAVTYRNVAIRAVINRLTDQIVSLTYSADCDFSADAAFVGHYAALGTQPVGFIVNETAAFEFTWPGITVAETLELEPGQTDVLRAESPCGVLSKEELTWTTSDESIATVNEEGYVTATHQSGQCTVTVAFTFMGKEYTADCTVTVKVPAEEIEISHRKLTLPVGGTASLEAKVKPKKATIRTVKWYSEDESVAAVDQNGTITAKRAGAVGIYAVSDDGYFKATCHVEVVES